MQERSSNFAPARHGRAGRIYCPNARRRHGAHACRRRRPSGGIGGAGNAELQGELETIRATVSKLCSELGIPPP
jgi:hypothetical protein